MAELKEAKEKLAVLEKKGEPTQANTVDIDKLKQQIATIEQERDGLKTRLTAKEQAEQLREIDVDIASGFDGFVPHIPAHLKTDEEKHAYVNQQKKMLHLAFKNEVTAKRDSEGKVVYYDAQGDVLVSAKDGSPLTAKDIVAKKFGSFAAVSATPKAAGSGSNAGGGVGVFKNSAEIITYIEKNHPELSGKDWNDKYESIARESGLMRPKK